MVASDDADRDARETNQGATGCAATLLALPFTLAYDTLRAIQRILSFPVGLYRRRISAQLIASHVLVVMLTAVLLGTAAIFLATGLATIASRDTSSGQSVIDQGRTIAALITPEQVSQLEAGGNLPVQSALDRLVVDGPPYAIDASKPSLVPNWALVVDRAGRVLAVSGDPGVRPGQPIAALGSPLVEHITARAIELDGGDTAYGKPFVFDSAGDTYAVVYPVPGDSGRPVAFVAFQHVGTSSSFHVPVGAVLAAVTVTGIVGLTILIFPALLVSVPVGVWRARAVSKRLGRLADAADAMAQGDLERRVTLDGEDEIGRLGERFNAMAAGLESADRARKAFVANVSHELRTPITVIQGHVERLAAGADGLTAPSEVTPALAHELAIIQGEVLTLSRLVDDLFTLARLEEAVLPVEPRRLDLAAVAAAAVESLRGPAWDQRKVTVRSVVPGDLPPVMADPTRLRQIFGNLLYNALRSTPEGGLIIVDAWRDGAMVDVAVSDTGVGIPAEELEAVFQRFYRTEAGARQTEGTGLGLAVVKQLVEAQGGTITVESQPGNGTTFRFTLPAAI